MSAPRTTQRLRHGAGADASELSVRLEQAILQLRDVERQLKSSIAEVLSLQHAVRVIELDHMSADHRDGKKQGKVPRNGRA
jgi:hypothetical protein